MSNSSESSSGTAPYRSAQGLLPESRYLATAGSNFVLEIHDVVTGTLLATSGEVPLVASFSPMENLVGWATVGGEAGVLDIAALARGVNLEEATIFEQEAHQGQIHGIALDGNRRLATAGTADALVRIWDIDSGDLLLEFPSGRDGTSSSYLAFAPDGGHLTYSDRVGLIRRFPLDVDSLFDLAKQRLTRDMTRDECIQYLDPATCPDEG